MYLWSACSIVPIVEQVSLSLLPRADGLASDKIFGMYVYNTVPHTRTTVDSSYIHTYHTKKETRNSVSSWLFWLVCLVFHSRLDKKIGCVPEYLNCKSRCVVKKTNTKVYKVDGIVGKSCLK